MALVGLGPGRMEKERFNMEEIPIWCNMYSCLSFHWYNRQQSNSKIFFSQLPLRSAMYELVTSLPRINEPAVNRQSNLNHRPSALLSSLNTTRSPHQQHIITHFFLRNVRFPPLIHQQPSTVPNPYLTTHHPIHHRPTLQQHRISRLLVFAAHSSITSSSTIFSPL